MLFISSQMQFICSNAMTTVNPLEIDCSTNNKYSHKKLTWTWIGVIPLPDFSVTIAAKVQLAAYLLKIRFSTCQTRVIYLRLRGIYAQKGVPQKQFFKNKISPTRQASAWGLVWRNPKGFLISTMFRGSYNHFRFDQFYIVDFHSALTFLDRDLAKF